MHIMDIKNITYLPSSFVCSQWRHYECLLDHYPKYVQMAEFIQIYKDRPVLSNDTVPGHNGG
jgi:hypothetical protein